MKTFYDQTNEDGKGGVVTFQPRPFTDFSVPVRGLPGWGSPRRSPAKRWSLGLSEGGEPVRHRSWLDHLYRLKYPDGRTVYRAEPYWVTEDDLDDLALLREDGWRIHIGGYPCHYPTTIVISIERRPPAS